MDPYGLTRPTLDDARDTVHRVHGADGAQVWRELTRTAAGSLDELLPVMEAADPTTRLCAVALRIRMTSYDCLAAAHTELRSQA